MNHKDVDLENHEYIEEFLENTKHSECDISGSVKATIAQFLMSCRLQMRKRGTELEQDWLYPGDIIDSQVGALRRCIIDLEAYKDRLTNGVTTQ